MCSVRRKSILFYEWSHIRVGTIRHRLGRSDPPRQKFYCSAQAPTESGSKQSSSATTQYITKLEILTQVRWATRGSFAASKSHRNTIWSLNRKNKSSGRDSGFPSKPNLRKRSSYQASWWWTFHNSVTVWGKNEGAGKGNGRCNGTNHPAQGRSREDQRWISH